MVKIPSGARGLKLGPSLSLYPYFVYASSEGSGESAYSRSIDWALVARHRTTNILRAGSNMNKAKYSTRISIKIIVYSDDISLALIERVTMIDH